MVHFNWTQLFVDHEYIHVATAAVAGGFMVLLSVAARLSLGNGEASIVPSKSFSLKAVFEMILEFIAGLTVTVIGEKGAKFAPVFASIFFFIFINNLFGLLPGMTPATDNINTNLAVGAFAFLTYNFYGIKEHGAAYVKQFMGPMLMLAPLMIVLELISHIVRPFSLALRLQGNMMGDHTVLGIFLELVPYVVPVIFYGLGIFVCFMQAFVFTMLTMIYISMAISHDH